MRKRTKFKKELIEKAPTIFAVASGVGVIVTPVIAAKDTTKAMNVIKIAQEESKKELTKKQKFKVAWKSYIPTVISATITMGCLIGSEHLNNKQKLKLRTAGALSEAVLRTYSKKVVETIGEEKDRAIRKEIMEEERKPSITKPRNTSNVNDFKIDETGKYWFIDKMSGRKVKTTKTEIRSVLADINFELTDSLEIDLNEFYYGMNMEPTMSGELIGWDVNRGKADVRFDTEFLPNGEPCGVFYLLNLDTYNYSHISL